MQFWSNAKLIVPLLGVFLFGSSIILKSCWQLILKSSYDDRITSNDKSARFLKDLPYIHAITCTYARPVQKAELTRLSQTLRQVPNLHWIIVEDSSNRSSLVANILKNSGIYYTHLYHDTDKPWYLRGLGQKNLGIEWIRKITDPALQKGVVYFADDDNAYDLQLFEEMRSTKGVSIWPVGLVGGVMHEGPICKDNKVIGYRSAFAASERYIPTDMAGFAINVRVLLKHMDVLFSMDGQEGFQESDFLKRLVDKKDLEPKADMCTKVLVWHTQTKEPDLRHEAKLTNYTKLEV